jgi:hypothetical protein
MLAETPAAFVDCVEHPTRAPTATVASPIMHAFEVFIFSFDMH